MSGVFRGAAAAGPPPLFGEGSAWAAASASPILQFRIVDPRLSDGEILSAASKFGFRVEGGRVWRAGGGEAVFRVDGYAAGGKDSCCCPLADDPEGLARLRGFLEFLLTRCSELYYAADEICLEEEPVEEIEPAAVHGTHRPGRITPWGRVRMPEQFARGLPRLARLMRRAGAEAGAGRSADGSFRFQVPELGIDVSAEEEAEAARDLLAELTWLWAEYGMIADESLSADAVELKRRVLDLVRAGIL